MVFGTCFTRFMRMAEATYSAVGSQLISRWHTAPFVRVTTGAWRRISTRGAINGVLLGLGVNLLHALRRSQSAATANEAKLRSRGFGNDGSAAAGLGRVRARPRTDSSAQSFFRKLSARSSLCAALD